MNILSAILIAFTCLFSAPDNQRNVDPDSWKVTVDEVRDGVRYVTAVPGGGVCSRRIELEIVVKGRTVRSCRFVGGCPGNTVGLCSLLEGMKVSEAIKISTAYLAEGRKHLARISLLGCSNPSNGKTRRFHTQEFNRAPKPLPFARSEGYGFDALRGEAGSALIHPRGRAGLRHPL